MRLFKKKVDEIETEKETESQKKPRKRRVKKETQKSWGRKERLFLFVVLVLTAGGSAFLGLSSREWKLPGRPKVDLKMPTIPFLTSEKIVLENVEQVEQVEQVERVKNEFNNLTTDLTGVYGLYVVDLDGGYSFGVNESEIFQAASLIKLPVIVTAYLQDQGGSLGLSEKYTLKSEDKVAGAGSLYGEKEGYELSYRDLIRYMGKESDNTAYRAMLNIVGEEAVNESMESMGMLNTSIEDNETTPKEIGDLFWELWEGGLLTESNKEELFEFLTDTVYEQWLSPGLPNDVQLAHKYGRETNVVNDAGIVFADEPYVIVVMSKGVVGREADEVFPEISKMAYEEMTNRPE